MSHFVELAKKERFKGPRGRGFESVVLKCDMESKDVIERYD